MCLFLTSSVYRYRLRIPIPSLLFSLIKIFNRLNSTNFSFEYKNDLLVDPPSCSFLVSIFPIYLRLSPSISRDDLFFPCKETYKSFLRIQDHLLLNFFLDQIFHSCFQVCTSYTNTTVHTRGRKNSPFNLETDVHPHTSRLLILLLGSLTFITSVEKDRRKVVKLELGLYCRTGPNGP